jgi:hypothetical protein
MNTKPGGNAGLFCFAGTDGGEFFAEPPLPCVAAIFHPARKISQLERLKTT